MSEVHVVAIITPRPGKEARIKELLTELANNVKENEPGAIKYEVFEEYDGKEGNKIVVIEIYKDQETFDAHFQTDYFKKLGESLPAEDLAAAPLDVKKIKPFAGFASR